MIIIRACMGHILTTGRAADRCSGTSLNPARVNSFSVDVSSLENQEIFSLKCLWNESFYLIFSLIKD